MERCELEVVARRRRAILDKTTLLGKGIEISKLELFMWT